MYLSSSLLLVIRVCIYLYSGALYDFPLKVCDCLSINNLERNPGLDLLTLGKGFDLLNYYFITWLELRPFLFSHQVLFNPSGLGIHVDGHFP
jgi:hypothetical protein